MGQEPGKLVLSWGWDTKTGFRMGCKQTPVAGNSAVGLTASHQSLFSRIPQHSPFSNSPMASFAPSLPKDLPLRFFSGAFTRPYPRLQVSASLLQIPHFLNNLFFLRQGLAHLFRATAGALGKCSPITLFLLLNPIELFFSFPWHLFVFIFISVMSLLQYNTSYINNPSQ